MHLTNYSINKNSQEFVRDDISGSKRRITTVNQWFSDNGYDIGKIWAGIEVISKLSPSLSILAPIIRM